jgi:hypothetical protein
MSEYTLEDAFEGAEVSEQEVADTTGEEAKAEEVKAEAEESSTPEEDDDQSSGSAPIAAVVAERKKRQEAERKLKEYEDKFASQTKEPTKVPDVFEDQDGYTKYLSEQVSQATWQARVDLTQELMRDRHEDYDEKEALFLQMANENPALLQDPAFTRNPAKFAYDTAVKAQKFEQMQNVDEYEAKIKADLEAKIRKEIEAEYEGKAQGRAKKREAVMPTLTNSGTPGGEADEGEESLGQLLKLG